MAIGFQRFDVPNLGPPAADYSGMLTGLVNNYEGAMERAQQRRYVDEAAELAKKYGGTFVNGQWVPAPGTPGTVGSGPGGQPAGEPGGGTRLAPKAQLGAATGDAQYLMSKGLTAEQAAGVIGHGLAESGANPTVRPGDAGVSHGYFQWNGARYTGNNGLLAWANRENRDPWDRTTQLDFALWEAQQDPKVWGALQSAQTVEDATKAWMHFERPQGYKADAPQLGHNYSGRLGYANQVYANLGLAANPQTATAAAPGTPTNAPVPVARPGTLPTAPLPAGAVTTSTGGPGGTSGLAPVAGAAPAAPGPAAAVAPRVRLASASMSDAVNDPSLVRPGQQRAELVAPLPPSIPTTSAGGIPNQAGVANAVIGAVNAVAGGGGAPAAAPAAPAASPAAAAPAVATAPAVPAAGAPAGSPAAPVVPGSPAGSGRQPEITTTVAGGPDARTVVPPAAAVPATPVAPGGRPLGAPAPVRPATAAPAGAFGVAGGGQGIPGDLLAAMIRVPGLREYAGKYLAEKAAQAKGTSYQLVGPNDAAARAALNIPANDKRTYQVDLTTRQATPLTEPPKDTQTFDQETKLRTEFEGQKVVQDYRGLEQGVQGLKAAFDEGNPAGDLVAVNQIMKAIDPGSTVSAGEVATVQNAPGTPDYIRSLWNKTFGSGGRISPEARANFYNTIVSLAENRRQQVEKIATSTRNLAKGYSLDPERSVGGWAPAKFERAKKDTFKDTAAGNPAGTEYNPHDVGNETDLTNALRDGTIRSGDWIRHRDPATRRITIERVP